MEGGDDVVVLLAFFVVEQDAALEGLGGDGAGDAVGGCGFGSITGTQVLRLRASRFAQDDSFRGEGEFGGDFESVEGVAGVSAGVTRRKGGESVFVGFQTKGAEAALRVPEGRRRRIAEGAVEERR